MTETEQNPFKTASPEIMAVVEQLLVDLWAAGEWDDKHENLAAQWREARWEAGMEPWRWYARIDGADDVYDVEADSREAVIEKARCHYPSDPLMIIEARHWDDRLKEGEDFQYFAMGRNRERIPALKPEGECCATALEGL